MDCRARKILGPSDLSLRSAGSLGGSSHRIACTVSCRQESRRSHATATADKSPRRKDARYCRDGHGCDPYKEVGLINGAGYQMGGWSRDGDPGAGWYRCLHCRPLLDRFETVSSMLPLPSVGLNFMVYSAVWKAPQYLPPYLLFHPTPAYFHHRPSTIPGSLRGDRENVLIVIQNSYRRANYTQFWLFNMH